MLGWTLCDIQYDIIQRLAELQYERYLDTAFHMETPKLFDNNEIFKQQNRGLTVLVLFSVANSILQNIKHT